MTSTFLIALEVGSDTDLNAIAQELADILDDHFEVISSKPWAHKNLTDEALVPPPPVAPANTTQQPIQQ